jgi:diguanylate cyclase (GGDEF)-like protein
MGVMSHEMLASRLRAPSGRNLRRLAVVVVMTEAGLVAVAPHLASGAVGERAVHAAVAGALALTALALLVRRRWPDWLLAALAIGLPTVLVLGLLATAQEVGVLPMLLFWSALASPYFRSRLTAILNLGVIAVGLAVVVAVTPDPRFGPFGWLVAVLACGMCTVAIRLVAEHGDTTIHQLTDNARRDPLTGLVNRREFDEQVARLWAGGDEFAVVFFDLDHFKIVNDTFGHAAGDAALREFARVLRMYLRDDDVVARTGGEEFGVLVPGRATGRVLERSSAVVETFGRTRTRTDDLVIRCTASAGIAVRSPRHTSAGQLCRDADRALYLAKDAGRNQVVMADPVPADHGSGTDQG